MKYLRTMVCRYFMKTPADGPREGREKTGGPADIVEPDSLGNRA
jgi:hypothetical protein